jgi:hypothetical protein
VCFLFPVDEKPRSGGRSDASALFNLRLWLAAEAFWGAFISQLFLLALGYPDVNMVITCFSIKQKAAVSRQLTVDCGARTARDALATINFQ